MKNKRLILFALFTLVCTHVAGQFHIPAMDVQTKMGVAFISDVKDKGNNLYTYSAPFVSGEINIAFTQHIAAGIFYSKGFSSQTKVEADFGGTTSYTSSHQLYGLKVRLSTGRQPKWRPFTELSYGQFEMYMQKNSYRISTSSKTVGFSLGLMVRLNNKMYLVIPQLSLRSRTDWFFFETSGKAAPLIEVSGGLSYNFGKKK